MGAWSVGEWRSRCWRSTILFGKYELLERINVGGMAEIVRARDTEAPGEPVVAVKRILPHLVEDQQFVTMFLDESRVLQSLHHPDIIQTLDVGTFEGVPYIALEYVDGKDARMVFHECRRQGVTVPIPLACFVMAEVCAGLHAAHEHTDAAGRPLGLVHRDVSLQNLLLSYDGAVRVTDFGIALSASNRARTEAGVVKGKFGYMSPEQIKSERMDRRSDVFAAGICLYELLTCERLFSGESNYAAIERVRNVDIDPPSAVKSDIPEALEGIVMKALSRRPKHRFATAAEMSEALRDFLATHGLHVAAPDLGGYLRALFGVDEGPEHTPVVATPMGVDVWADPAALPDIEPPSDDDTAVKAPAIEHLMPEETGLAAFENLDPVSVVTGLEDRVEVTPIASPLPSRAPQADSAPRVPPIVPNRSSVPPPYGSPSAHGMAVALPMEWGEDDPPTRSNGPEGVAPLMEVPEESRPPFEEHPVLVERTFTGSSVPPEHAFRGAPLQAGFPSGPPLPQALLPTDPPAMPERRVPIVPAGIAIAAIIAATTLGLVLAKSSGPGRVLLETEPADAVVMVNGARVADAVSPYEIGDLDPDNVHVITVSREGYSSWTTRIRVQPGRALALPVVTLEPSEQPAVATNADSLGASPDAAREAASSPSRLRGERAEASGQRSGSAARDAERGARRRRRLARERSDNSPRERRPVRDRNEPRQAPGSPRAGAMGTLRINSRPWSQVIIDGRPVGNTPQMSLRVPAGRHVIELVNPQFNMRKRLPVTVAADQVVTRVVDLN